MNPQKFAHVIEECATLFRGMAEAGCTGFDCPEEVLELMEGWGKGKNRPRLQPLPDTLDRIRMEMGECMGCGLASGRKKPVFGTGNPKARLVFVGEGPGHDEDVQGEPFVGAAGQLLTKIIQAMNLTREEVYICNIVKCRPPGNRTPEPEEIRACLPFVERQIAAIQPDLICALGTVAARTLLNTTRFMSELRGRFHDYRGIRVMPTYHPAHLLRHPEKKREVWEDIKMLMQELQKGDERRTSNIEHPTSNIDY